MKEIIYEPNKRIISTNINGTRIILNPVIRNLTEIANDLVKTPKKRGLISTILHNNWGEVCPHELHGRATMASEKFRYLMPETNHEKIEFAATEIGLGNIPLINWNHDKQDLKVLQELEDIGTTYLCTKDKNEAEELIRTNGLPIFLSLNDFPYKEKRDAFKSFYRFIDKTSLFESIVKKFDMAITEKDHPEKERYDSLNLDPISVDIGLKLYKQGLVSLKLYSE